MESDDLKRENTNYFHQPVFNMLWGGVAIYDIKNPQLSKAHKIYSFFLLLTCGYGYILTEIIHAYKHFHEMEELTFTMCYLIAHFIGIGKVIVLSVQREKIGKCLSSLEQGVFLPDIERGGEEEVKIVDRAILQTNTQARIFGLAVVLMLCTRIIPIVMKTTETVYDEITNSTRLVSRYPYPSTLPFPINDQISPNYEFLFFYQAFCITLFGWYLGNADTIITGLMIHVTAQFRIVTNAVLTVAERAERITNININGTELKPIKNLTMEYRKQFISIEVIKKYDGLFAENLKRCIRNCVIHHHEIINLLGNLEDTFSLLLLIQFLGSLTGLCVGLYQTSVLPITNPSFVSMSMFTLAMCFQLLIYCWNGNEVMVHSVLISKAAYNCEWLQSDNDVKTSLILIMMRAQRVGCLTAGKFVNISLETFAAILRGSVSYFMVLRRLNEEELEK